MTSTDVERLDDRREARAEGGRRFQREWAITAKDLEMVTVALIRGTKSSRLSRERRGLFKIGKELERDQTFTSLRDE